MGLKNLTAPHLPILLQLIQLQNMNNIHTGQAPRISRLWHVLQAAGLQRENQKRHIRAYLIHEYIEFSLVVFIQLYELLATLGAIQWRQVVTVDHVHESVGVGAGLFDSRLHFVGLCVAPRVQE